MTGDVVNLRRARKARECAERETVAAANRLSYGRTKVQRQANAMEIARGERLLDGHRLASRDDVPRDGDDA